MSNNFLNIVLYLYGLFAFVNQSFHPIDNGLVPAKPATEQDEKDYWDNT